METIENARYSFIVKAIRANVDDKVLCNIFGVTLDELEKYKTIVEIIDDKTSDYISFINFLIGNIDITKKVKSIRMNKNSSVCGHWKKELEKRNIEKVLIIAKNHYENDDVLTVQQIANITDLSSSAIRSYIKKNPELHKYVRSSVSIDSSIVKDGASIIE